MCNGPYSALKTALRKRGWIEKNFNYASACCKMESEEDENNTNNSSAKKDCQNDGFHDSAENTERATVKDNSEENSKKSNFSDEDDAENKVNWIHSVF